MLSALVALFRDPDLRAVLRDCVTLGPVRRWVDEQTDVERRILHLQAVGRLSSGEAKSLRRQLPGVRRAIVEALERDCTKVPS